MTSKGYFIIAGIFIAVYIISSLWVIAGVPEWAHRGSMLIFAGAAFLGVKAQRKEKAQEEGK